MAYSNANYKKKNAQSMRRNNNRDFRKNPNPAGQKFPTGFCSPYNFVPLWEGVYKRYSSPENLPHHDEFQLCTGTISCTFTSKTPVCVSDGKKDEHSDFFRDAEGNYVLPGSTLKGLMRTNMMILGFGAMRPGEDFEDILMHYRDMFSARASLRGDLKDTYLDTVKKKLDLPEKTIRVPNVCACYLKHHGDKFTILHAKCFRLKRYHTFPERRKTPNPLLTGELRSFLTASATEKPVAFRLNDQNQVTDLRLGAAPPGEGWLTGTLLAPGEMKGQNTLYLFHLLTQEEMAKFTGPQQIPWPKEDRLIYEMDYDKREKVLGKDKDFWALPNDGEEKPFFVLGSWERNGISMGKDVAKDFHHRDRLILGRSPYLRIPYNYPPSSGLRDKFQDHQDASDSLVLDYPYALLGYSSTVNGQREKENLAYRSRVSFGDFHTRAKQSETVKKERVLASPKPTSFPDYLLDGKNYNEEVFQLRGIKQYWLHPVNNEPKDPKQRDLDAKKKENVTSSLVTLPAGTTFTGHIRFHNLDKDELGLLLWCLTLGKPWDLTEEQPYFQTVGKGKPYGFGRMSVSIDRIELLHPEQLYSPDSLHGMAIERLEQEHLKTFVAQRIKDYVQHIQSEHLSGASLKDQPSITDFLYMHSCIRNQKQVEYTVLSEYRNRVMLLQTVEEQRNALNRSGQAE